MSKFMIVPLMVLMLGIRMPMAAETQIDEGSADGAKGFGIGALVGGLVGGPVGALVGAAGGAYFAEQDAAKNDTIDNLEATLEKRDSEMATLKHDAEQTQVAMTGDMPILERRPGTPISMPVYFRTDNAAVEESIRPHLAQLARYLQDYPELSVQLEGYSDRRGDSEYNQVLSQRRIATIRLILEKHGIAADRIREYAYGESRAHAEPGETDAMVYDRAVVITVGDTDASRA
jgi:outer membrane protein OmpA-like peptidoglycan-associated protein